MRFLVLQLENNRLSDPNMFQKGQADEDFSYGSVDNLSLVNY